MKRSRLLVGLFAGLMVILSSVVAFSQLPPGIPRNEMLVVDQIHRYAISNDFNLWMARGPTPTRQGLIFDTLWGMDQQTGEWINSLAKERPIYNEDFTKMTVKLRKGIYWSDGVEFTADDVVFTVKNLKSHPVMLWGSDFDIHVDEVYKIDDYTVVFKLKETNPRFHYLFLGMYNACYIQPKHVWKKVEKPLEFTFYPPVSLGPYILKDSDLAGYWELFERREDWERTTVGKIHGKPAPKYVLTVFYGPSEKKVMAMLKHELDLLMDVDYEAFQVLLKKNPYARCWYRDYPWAWFDEPCIRFFGINVRRFPYNIKDVRWALALALDMVEIATEYLGGSTRAVAIYHPGGSIHMKLYHKPLESWLKEFKLEIEDGVYFKPYDSTVPERIATWAEKQGYTVPSEREEIIDMFGIGWWKHAPEVSEKLLKKHGFRRDAKGKWLLPDGTPWKIKILAPIDEVENFRIALAAVDQWEEFGIESEVEPLERELFLVRAGTGDFTCISVWGCSFTLGDKWDSMKILHSKFYRPIGEPAIAGINGNICRLKSDYLDQLIDKMGQLHPEDPQVVELGKEFMKWWTENMWGIPAVSVKKLLTQDEYYWTHFPTADDPYGQPCYWYTGVKFVLPYLEPTGRK